MNILFSALSNIFLFLFIQIGKNEKSDKTRWCESIKSGQIEIYTEFFLPIQCYVVVYRYKILSSYLNRTSKNCDGMSVIGCEKCWVFHPFFHFPSSTIIQQKRVLEISNEKFHVSMLIRVSCEYVDCRSFGVWQFLCKYFCASHSRVLFAAFETTSQFAFSLHQKKKRKNFFSCFCCGWLWILKHTKIRGFFIFQQRHKFHMNLYECWIYYDLTFTSPHTSSHLQYNVSHFSSPFSIFLIFWWRWIHKKNVKKYNLSYLKVQ